MAFEIRCAAQTAPEEIALTLGCGTDDGGRSRTDWNVLLGGGLAYRAGGGAAIRLEGRYDFGLTEIDDTTGLEVHNRSFVLTSGGSVPVGDDWSGRRRLGVVRWR